MPRKCVCASSVIMGEGKVLLLWHKKLSVWLYPGGHVEENETPQETAERETLEETGLKIKIFGQDTKEGKMFSNREASELPRPFLILYEHVPYKTGEHEHFDMVYLARPDDRKADPGKKEENETRWFSESEIDGLETFENVKWALHRAFSAMK